MTTPSKKLIRFLACTTLFASLAAPARATLMEFGWSYKWGSGSIIYDNAIADSEPTTNSWFFRDSIVSYDLVAWEMMTPHRYAGTGGSIGATAFPPTGQCPLTGFDPCWASGLVFYLGQPPSDGSPRYQLEVDAPIPLNHDGSIRQFDRTSLENFDALRGSGFVSNDQNGITYGTMDPSTPVWNLPVQAVAIPTTGTASLALLALLGLAGARSRRVSCFSATRTGIR